MDDEIILRESDSFVHVYIGGHARASAMKDFPFFRWRLARAVEKANAEWAAIQAVKATAKSREG